MSKTLSKSELTRHRCVPNERVPEYDGQGIFLCYVCPVCRTAKLAGYRPEILRPYTQADVDEDIDADVWFELEESLDRGDSPIEFTDSPQGRDALDRWARAYDDRNGAPEDDSDR